MATSLNYALFLSILLITLSLAEISCQKEPNMMTLSSIEINQRSGLQNTTNDNNITHMSSNDQAQHSFAEEQVKRIEYNIQKEWLAEKIDKLTLEANQMKDVLKTINLENQQHYGQEEEQGNSSTEGQNNEKNR